MLTQYMGDFTFGNICPRLDVYHEVCKTSHPVLCSDMHELVDIVINVLFVYLVYIDQTVTSQSSLRCPE